MAHWATAVIVAMWHIAVYILDRPIYIYSCFY